MTEFVAHLHPLLVHLPIGILLFAFALMLFGRVKSVNVEPAVSLAWFLGALSALMACGAGWLLAQSGEYDEQLIQVHQWTGLATAGLSTLTYFSRRYRWVPAVGTVLLLNVAGHFGGNLTHGEGYLFATNPQMSQKPPSDSLLLAVEQSSSGTTSVGDSSKPLIRRTFYYRDKVTPILESKCYGCHSARKKKGGLRLDTEVFMRKGGKNGSVFTAGNPQKSKLFSYLLLPDDDDRHMPPKGKRQLTPQEMAIIHHWIATGASFKEEIEVIQPSPGLTALPVTEPDPVLVFPARTDSLKTQAPTQQGAEALLLAKPVSSATGEALETLKKQQIRLSPIAGTGNYLSANFVNVRAFQPSMLNDLETIKPQLVHLKLTGQPISDEDLRKLAGFKNLTRLNLEHTNITDAGLVALHDLPVLEQVNLYGTAITDTGLSEIARWPTLKVVYLWQTQTTPDGIARLRRVRPTLKIETGGQQLLKPDTSKAL